MSRSPDIIVQAIEDWRRRGMISDDLAKTLHMDAEGVARERGRAQLQYALGSTAGFILLLAAGAFVARNWGTLDVTMRCGVLAAVGVALVLGARLLERRARMEPVALLLRASGLAVLMAAYVYSDNAWEVGSIGAIVVGVASLLTPLLSLLSGSTDRPGPTAVNTIAAYGFLAIFLNRVGVHQDSVVWILDAIMLASLLVLGWRLRTKGDHPGLSRSLTAFIASLFGGMVLVWMTVAGPLDAGDDAVWALDAWWALMVVVLLWGLHASPSYLRRQWYDDLLGACVVIAIPLAFWTLSELGFSSRWSGIGPGLLGGLGLGYGLRHSRTVVWASCLALLAAAIAIADVGNRNAASIVLILGATAGLLFWVAARLARKPDA